MGRAKVDNVGKIVEVRWEDAWTQAGQEYTVKEAAAEPPIYCTIYGIVVKDDKDAITLAQGKFDKDGWMEGGYRQLWSIPRGMVRKVRVLK